MRCRLLGAFTTLLLLSPAPAAADWLLSPYVGVRFATNTTLFFALDVDATDEKKFLWGISSALLTDGVFGLEVDFAYVPGFFGSGGEIIASSRVITLSGNAILAMPLGVTTYGLRPYVTGGLGLMHARSTPPSNFGPLLQIDSNFLALNLGAGALGPVSPRSSIRFDLRYFRNMKTDEEAPVLPEAAGAQLSFWRGTVGLAVRF